MLVSMDMSMRSSGLVALTPRNEIVGLDVIKTSLDDFPDHEDTIIHVIDATMDFIAEFSADAFVIEGLSHGAVSAHKDVIAGIFWGRKSGSSGGGGLPRCMLSVTAWTRYPCNAILPVSARCWGGPVVPGWSTSR